MSNRNSSPKLKSVSHLKKIKRLVAAGGDAAWQASRQIWEFAEPPMGEVKSSKTLAELLSQQGFKVSWPWKSLPTAFRAQKKTAPGKGPIIALLAEYDALPDCGAAPGQWGHGCGHNLLGAGSALAGVAAAKLLEDLKLPATIAVFGCPAEETLAGKVYMAMEGAFKGLDAALGWHPSGNTGVNGAGMMAMDSMLLRFAGRTAHGASAHMGRSALDAAMLTDVAVNYLREHVEDNVRIHCIITKGGKAPNVVPDAAEIWYFVRGRDREQVDDLRKRVLNCAKGAALATDTTVTMAMKTCIPQRIASPTLNVLLESLLKKMGKIPFTAADDRAAAAAVPKAKYNTEPNPTSMSAMHGSSDEDNVSWFAPMSTAFVACTPQHVTGHHRTYSTVCRLEPARKGLLHAATMLAAAAVELAINPPLLKRAQAQHKQALKGKKYDLPLTRKAIREFAKPPAV